MEIGDKIYRFELCDVICYTIGSIKVHDKYESYKVFDEYNNMESVSCVEIGVWGPYFESKEKAIKYATDEIENKISDLQYLLKRLCDC